MRDLGFAASAWTRAVAGVGFCVVALGMVWVIERPRADVAQVTRPSINSPADAVRVVPLTLDSTYRVAQWSVSVLGHEQPATHSDEYTWAGTVSAAEDSEVLITASSALTPAGESKAPNQSLRVTWEESVPRVVWGSGDITTTLVVSKPGRQVSVTAKPSAAQQAAP